MCHVHPLQEDVQTAMKLAKRGYKGPEAPKWSLVHGADGHGARWQGLVFFLKEPPEIFLSALDHQKKMSKI